MGATTVGKLPPGEIAVGPLLGMALVEVCSHHLLSTPVPPSARVSFPVPAELEALLLQCLQEDPARRPESAAQVRNRLLSLEGLGAWRELDSARWWERFRPELQLGRRQSIPSGTRAIQLAERS